MIDTIEKIARAYCVNLGLDPDEPEKFTVVSWRTDSFYSPILVADETRPRWMSMVAEAKKAHEEYAMKAAMIEVMKGNAT